MLLATRRQIQRPLLKIHQQRWLSTEKPSREYVKRWTGNTQMFVTFAKGLGLATALGVAGIGTRAMFDEGTARSLKFWGTAFPIYCHYRAVQWQTKGKSDEEIDEAFNALHDRYAPVAEALTLEMRGFYLKNAQTISTMDFFLPPQYMEWCKRCQDEVPTEMTFDQVKKIIVDELDISDMSEVFSEFDEIPVGCASIGQVHRARLLNGDEVAVKIQSPGIERKFRADIKVVKDFCWLAMPQHIKPMEEIEKQFVTEFDYVGEAKNLQETRDNVMPVFGDLVNIPAPYMDLCTKDVLVMEYLEGKNLLKGVKEMFSRYAKQQGKTYDEIVEEQKELMRSGKLQLRDINEEAVRMNRYKQLAKVSASLSNVCRMVYNYSIGNFAQKLEYVEPQEVINLAEIVRVVATVHGHEIMVDGVFNGDPHLGNILCKLFAL